MTIDATNEFNQVRQDFEADGLTALSTLSSIADSAKTAVLAEGMNFLEDWEMRNELGLYNAPEATKPSEPDDPGLFTQALAYLDYLQGQALLGATFPTYAELFPDEPPSSPTVDTSTPTTFDIQNVVAPAYTVPTWDDSSAWSGGDLSLDGTIGPLVAPFSWTERSHTSAFLNGGTNVLYEAMKADILSVNYGLDELDEGRLWDRARERENRLNSAAVEAATRLFASGGFTAPTGAAQAAIDRANSDTRDKVASISREIMAQKAALFLEAKKIAFANGLELEKTTMNFYNAESEFILKRIAQEITSTVEVSTFNIERIKMYVEKYKGYAEAFASQVAGQKGIAEMYASQVQAEGTKAEANRAIYEALASKNKAVIDQYVAALQGFQTVMDARVRYHNVLADVYKTQMSQVVANMDATKGAYDLVDKQQKNLIDFRLGKYNGELLQMKTKIDEIMSVVNARIEQLKTQAQSIAAVAVGAMNGMNVNLGLSLSGSTNIGGSESHAYDETKGTDSGKNYNYTHQWDETKGTDAGTTHSIEEQFYTNLT